MNVIVIRKVWNGEKFNIGGLNVIFRYCADKNNKNQEEDIDTKEYDLIFLHINNDEAASFFNSLTNEQKDKIILFSTDAILKSSDFAWCAEYPFMGKMSNWNSFKRLNWHNIKDEMSLNEIIKALTSPKNTHIIALSILCQGYLSAHGKIEGLPDSLKKIAQENQSQVNQAWWMPALGEELKGEELIKELEALNKITIFGKLKEDGHQAVINALTIENGEQLTKLVTTIHELLTDDIFFSKK